MKARDVMTGWSTLRAGMLALAVLLGGMPEAQAQTPPTTLGVTTRPVAGAAGDMVVASLVDAGVKTGASVVVTLRIVDANGAVVAQTSGPVSESAPLRLSYRASAATGLSAQVIVPMAATGPSVPVLTLERWRPVAAPPPPPLPEPERCVLPSVNPRPPPTDGPVTLCLAVSPECTCSAVSEPGPQ
jgi:hypothetical protein